MKKFTTVSCIAAHLPMVNIDTDMIIPKQYLKTIKRTGLGQFLFSELRFTEKGEEKPDFILNQPLYRHTEILLAADNFGCGSSREHAVWSFIDFGIKVIIAPSFGDIFYNNAFKNGLLLIRLPQKEMTVLAALKGPMTVNLETETISAEGINISFVLEPYQRNALLEGLDEIADTLKYAPAIAHFEKQHQQQQPWITFTSSPRRK